MAATASSEPVALSLGSNRGDSLAIFAGAVAVLSERLRNPRCSPLYISDPMYILDQPPYLNAVLVGYFNGTAHELLAFVQSIEAAFGRNRNQERRRGERTLDIDILLYGDHCIEDGPALVIPHPLMSERKFVLLPLLSLLPKSVNPETGDPWWKSLELLGSQGIYYASLEPYNCPPGGIHGNRDSGGRQTVPTQGI